jgi:hypothetical protein
MKLLRKKLGVIAVCCLAVVFMVPQNASALVETPDEEDVLDIVDGLLVNPDLLPQLVDVGLIHQAAEDLLPDLIDVYPNVAVGACGLGTAGPSKSESGLRVVAAAAYSCSGRRAKIEVVVCIQIRQGDQWVIMEGSCRSRAGADQSSVSKRTSAYCRPGTWKYRVIAAAEATGTNGSQDLATRTSGPATLQCRTFGL